MKWNVLSIFIEFVILSTVISFSRLLFFLSNFITFFRTQLLVLNYLYYSCFIRHIRLFLLLILFVLFCQIFITFSPNLDLFYSCFLSIILCNFHSFYPPKIFVMPDFILFFCQFLPSFLVLSVKLFFFQFYEFFFQ